MADGISRFERMEEDIRRLKLRHTGGVGSDTKTFIIGGAITTELVVPPLFVSVNPDGNTPESKYLWGFRAVLGLGTATMSWFHNGTWVSDHDVTTTPSLVTLPAPIALADGDRISIEWWLVSSSPNAMDIAAAAIFVPSA